MNKEKALSNYVRPGGNPNAAKSRDVIYWYLDYREFSDVVKYRIAMMRKSIDIKVKNEAGKRGYICPSCGKAYDPLDLAGTFDPSAGAFFCEVCSSELVEDDPALHEDGQDRMSRFNEATAPIRDALKAIDGARLPTINVVAWIAQNVATESVAAVGDGSGAARRVGVVIGEVDDSAAKRDAEAQRKQNAIPTWHLESTVTGERTTLGMSNAARDDEEPEAVVNDTQQDEDDALKAHYANMDDDEYEDEDMDEAELEQPKPETGEPSPEETPVDTPGDGTPAAAEVTVMVNGVPKLLSAVTEADEEMMTPDEYQDYFDATSQAV